MKLSLALHAASAAAKALKNEKTRPFVILGVMFLCCPVIMMLLFFTVIMYIITNPMSALKGALGSDISLEDFKNSVDVIQYSAVDNYDAIDYTDETLEQCRKKIVYYNQLEAPWRNMLYGSTATIGHSGCGPTSMAIVISTLTGQKVTPAQLADWSSQNGYLVTTFDKDGADYSSSHALIPAAARHYNLTCTGVSKNADTKQRLKKALINGKLIVAIMGKGHFTKGGHFIVLTGMEDGKVCVADCASRSRTSSRWELDLIIEEARNGAGAGGPFWIIDQ